MGKSKPKMEVDLYYMSIHFGICAEADAIKRIIIKEKLAWSGYAAAQTTIVINKPDLFGGNKKEGGAVGTVHWLPGEATQVLPDELATRLGRSGGTDAPGYRGLASAFFIGGTAGGATGVSGSLALFITKGAASANGGFYWSANQPYLPGTWITVQRAPKGLDPDIAMIARPGSDFFPYEQPASTVSGPYTNVANEIMASTDNASIQWWDLESRQATASAVGADAFAGTLSNWALAGDGTAYAIGQYVSGVDVISALYACPPGGPYVKTTSDSPWFVGPTRAFQTADGLRVLTAIPSSGGYVDMGVYVPGTNAARDFCVDADGDVWQLEHPLGSSNHIVLSRMTVSALVFTVTGLVTRTSTSAATFCHVAEFDHFFVVSDGKWYTIDDTTGTIKASGSYALPTANLPRDNPQKSSYWADFTEVSLEDASTIRTVNASSWVAETTVGDELYDPVNHALWTPHGAHHTIRFLDRGDMDANPAHIAYEVLTNTDWGMGSPSTMIDVDSFNDAAQELFDEPLGLSMIWTRQASAQDFIQEVLDHIQAVLFVDPQTGLLTLKLIRGDYDPDDLSTIDPSTATLTNFGRKLWGEITNEITVTWTNPDNEQDETVTVHDLASITTQGGIVSDSRNYYGVRSATVAARLAARDLRSAGAPLATCEAEVDRTEWALRPASVLKIDWPEYGLEGVVMRVTSIDYGKPGDPALKIGLVEDVFGLDAGAYIEPPTSSWEDPSSAPAPLTHEAVFTMPLFFAANSTVAGFVDTPEYPEVIAGVLGTTAATDAFSWELWDEIALADGTPEWTNLQTNSLAGYAELVGTLDAEVESTFVSADFDNAMGQTGPALGGFVLIGDGTEQTSEIALITSVGTDFTVSRGVLDTVPRAWPIGTPVWFLDNSSLFEDPVLRSAAEDVSYKFRTRTSRGLLSLAAAPLVEYTLTERPWLPNRPADVKAYGVAFSSATSLIDAIARPNPWVTVTWANRNRLTEDGQVLAWTDATTAPETAQTTTIDVLAPDETPITSHTGLTGTSFNVPDASFGSEPIVILRTSSLRTDTDGTFGSLQFFDHWVTVGVVSAVEGDAGVGAFSGVGNAIRVASLSASGSGAMSATGVSNTAGAFSGSGVAALAETGGRVVGAALSGAGVASTSVVGGSGPTATPHRYWRIYIGTPNTTNTSFFPVIAEIEMRESVGGSDVTGSGTASASSQFSGSFTPAMAFANDGKTTRWATTLTTYPHWIRYDFGSGVTKAIVEVGIMGADDAGNTLTQAAGAFKVQSSDDDTTWTDEWWVAYPGGANGHSYVADTFRTFTKPSSSQLTGTPHRYWRLSITGSNGGSFVGAADIEMSVLAGGNDETEGGTATSRSNFGGLPPSNPFTGMFNNTSEWASNNVGFPEWIQYDFGSGITKSISEVRYKPRSSVASSQSPTGIDFQWSDDGSSWTTIRSVTGITGWTSGIAMVWSLP